MLNCSTSCVSYLTACALTQIGRAGLRVDKMRPMTSKPSPGHEPIMSEDGCGHRDRYAEVIRPRVGKYEQDHGKVQLVKQISGIMFNVLTIKLTQNVVYIADV